VGGVRFIAWIKKKKELTPIFPSISAITKEYYAYEKDHPNSSHKEALLHAIRWRFNRAFFGSENPSPGSKLFGEFPDEEIVRVLKECGSYELVEKAAAFVATIEFENAKQKREGFEPFSETIAKYHFNLSGIPWRPNSIKEVEEKYWKEIELVGLILRGDEDRLS
jgi:hypothetical protein